MFITMKNAIIWRIKLSMFIFVFAMLASSSYSQEKGFLSLDCGGSGNYTDSAGIVWVADDGYIKTGEKVSLLNYGYNPQSPELPREQTTLRKFPEMIKNCYELRPVVIGSKYLLRATFIYGNYDNLNSPPTFYLIIDSTIWDMVKFDNSVQIQNAWVKEVIFVAKFNPTNVCLAKSSGNGVPIISSLELRHLDMNMYWPANERFLLNLERTNFGVSPSAANIRYPYDPFDRVWSPAQLESYFPFIYTDKNVSTRMAYDRPPSKVMQTGILSPPSSPCTLLLRHRQSAHYGNLCFEIYFAELEASNKTSRREFDLYLDDQKLFGPIKPMYLQSSNFSILKPYGVSNNMTLSFKASELSNLPPLVNALEIFWQGGIPQNGTLASDVKALGDIQKSLNFKYLSAGDPCLPVNFSWDWLSCNSNSVPRIVSLKLSNKGLSGAIPSSIANLSGLVALDLSNNKLTGSIPEFLSGLTHLQELNLENNKLEGPVPATLFNRKGLNLRLSGNSLDCQGKEDCHNPKNAKAIILCVAIAGVSIIVFLQLVFMLVMYKKRRIKGTDDRKTSTTSLIEFTYNQLKKMTNQFSNQIGRGGYGPVFYGQLPNGEEVAVKVLSENSKQGAKEFKNEVSLLSRLHHKNLVALVGYCCESKHRILIYEYMAKGSLNELLRRNDDTKTLLDWEHRVGIALSAAQGHIRRSLLTKPGLEYLHNGCRPRVIHRDVKTGNILINNKMEAKISDFGLSRDGPNTDESHVITDVKGTMGYLDPQYITRRALTDKSDVYSFGVVILEIITGRQVIGPLVKSNSDGYVVSWARSMIKSGRIEELIDKRAAGDIPMSAVWKLIELALKCTELNDLDRPTMNEVVTELEETNRILHASKAVDAAVVSPASLVNEISSIPFPR